MTAALQGVEQLEPRQVMAGDATIPSGPLPTVPAPAVTAARLASQTVAPAAPTNLVVGWSTELSQPDSLSFRFGDAPQPGDTWSVLENGVPIAVNTRAYRKLATDTWETNIAAVEFEFTGKAAGELARNPVMLPSGYPNMRVLTAGNRYEIRVTRGPQSTVGQPVYGRFGGAASASDVETQAGTVALLDLDCGGVAPAGTAVMRGAQGEQVAALVVDAGRKITLRIGELGKRQFFTPALNVQPADLRAETNRPGVVAATVAKAQGDEWTLTIDTAPLAGRSGMVSVRIVNTSPDVTQFAPRYLGVIVKDAAGKVPVKPDWLAIGAVNTNEPDSQNFFRGTAAGDPTGFKNFDTQYIYLNDGPLMRPQAPVTPTSPLENNPRAWRTASGGLDGRKLVQSLRESAKFGAVPQIVYYNIMTPDESREIALANLQNRPFMVEYFKDLRFTVDTIRRFASGSTVSLILEPDLLAYMMQSARDGKTYRDPATIPAMTDAAYEAGLLPDPGAGKRLPNTLPGFVEAINRGVRFLASRTVNGAVQSVNLEYGWKFNLWAYDTGYPGNIAKITDVLEWTKGRDEVANAARTTADWYRKAGILTGVPGRTMDFIALDKYGTDGGATGAGYPLNGDGYKDPTKAPFFWNADHWNNYLFFAKTLHESLGGLPVRLWQIPVGHVNGSQYVVNGQQVPDLANVDRQWEDSAASYFFGDVFTGRSAGRDPQAAATYFSADKADDPLVTTDATGRVIWLSHMQAARDAGIESIMFGPGLANSTQGGGYKGPPLDGYYWAAKAQEYLRSPTPLRQPGLLGSAPAARPPLTVQATVGPRRADGSTPSAFVTIRRTGDLTRPLALPVRVVGGTAQAGSDYDRRRLERAMVSFAKGRSTAVLAVPLLPTRSAQPRETIAVQIGGPQAWLPSLRVNVTLPATRSLLDSSGPAAKTAAVATLANQMRAVETFSDPTNPGQITGQLKSGGYPQFATNTVGEVSATNGLAAYPKDGRNTPGAFQVDLANMGIKDPNNVWRETFGEWLGTPGSLKNASPFDTRIALSRSTLAEFFRIEVDDAGLITRIPAAAAAVFLHDDALAAASAAAWDPAANPLIGQHIDNFQEEQLSLYLAGRSPVDASTGVQDARRAPQPVMALADALQQQVARSFMWGYYQKFQNHPAYSELFSQVKEYFGSTLKITASTEAFGVKQGQEFWCRLNGSFVVAGTYVRGEGNMFNLLTAFNQAAQTGRGTWIIEPTDRTKDVTFTRVTPAGTKGMDAIFTVDKTPLNESPTFPSIFHYGAVVSRLDDGVDWNDKASWGIKDRNTDGGLGYARLAAEKTVTGSTLISQPGRYVYEGLDAGQTLTLSGTGPFFVYARPKAGGGPVITPTGYKEPANNNQQVGPGGKIDISEFGLTTPQQVFDASFYGWSDGTGQRMAKVNDPAVPDGTALYLYFVPAAGGDPAAVLANKDTAFWWAESPYSRSARVAASSVGVLGRPASAEAWAANFILSPAPAGTGVIDATQATGKVIVFVDDSIATVKLGGGSMAVVALAANKFPKTYLLNPQPAVGSGARPFLSLRPGDVIDATAVVGGLSWTIDNREQQTFDSQAPTGSPYLKYAAFSRYFATNAAGKRMAEFWGALRHSAVLPDPAAVIRDGLVPRPAR